MSNQRNSTPKTWKDLPQLCRQNEKKSIIFRQRLMALLLSALCRVKLSTLTQIGSRRAILATQPSLYQARR